MSSVLCVASEEVGWQVSEAVFERLSNYISNGVSEQLDGYVRKQIINITEMC